MTRFAASRRAMIACCAGGLALFALAGCGKQAPAKGAHAAGGEVLPGTISDAMLDPERSQARAPLQPARPSRPSVDDLVPAAPADSTEAEPAVPAGGAVAPAAPAKPAG